MFFEDGQQKIAIGCGVEKGMLPSFCVKKAAHCIELAKVKSENFHVEFVLRVWGCHICDSGCYWQPKITGANRQILFKWLPPQTQHLHGFFRRQRARGEDFVPDDARRYETDDPVLGQHSSRRGFLTGALALGGAASYICDPTSAAQAEQDLGGTSVNPRLFSFIGGNTGEWVVVSAESIIGDPLPKVERLNIVNGAVASMPDGGKWLLRGVTSNVRYINREEKDHLVKNQAALGRAESIHAALIPIRKNAKWWELTQDERRAIFEERSRHNAIGGKYLPGIARRLHHCRDLGDTEPFDFLTLFDYARKDAQAFDDLVAALRATEEWKYVEREVDIRLVRAS